LSCPVGLSVRRKLLAPSKPF